MNKLLLTFCCIVGLYNLGVGQAGFNIPESACLGQSFTAENTSVGGSTFYWNFCSGNLASNPIGDNLGNIGNLNMPVYSMVIKDGSNYFVFITNLGDGTITRLNFGNSLSNNPIATNLGNLGVLVRNIEGIQINKDNATGKWFGLIAGFSNNYLLRLDFGNSLQNTPIAENLGNIGNLMESTHTLYTFEENNNWFTLVGNYASSRLTLLKFGTSLGNTPSATDLGNVGNLNGPVGFFPVLDNGKWYLFVANQIGNSISRLDFGSSLTNQPTGVNLGNIGSVLNAPRSIIIIRDCGIVIGFVVNEKSNDIVRIAFPNGLTSQPTGESLGNVGTFSFPHHISQLFRDGDAIYCFVTNVNNNTLTRIIFKGCPYPAFPSSALRNPPPITYNVPGVYNISLVVDEGLPSQSNICKQITVDNLSISVNPVSSEVCEGRSTQLSASGAITYLWSPAIGLSATSGATVVAAPPTTTTYTVVGSVGQSCTSTKTVVVKVNPKPTISVVPYNPEICEGDSVQLNAQGAMTYSWAPPDGLSSLINARVTSRAATTTKYVVTGTDNKGCTGTRDLLVTVDPKPSFSGITTSCGSNGKNYAIELATSGDRLTSKYGQIALQNMLYTITNVPRSVSNIVTSYLSITGCKDSVIVPYPNCPLPRLFVPESFSPNNDGINDLFEIPGIEAYPEAELTIFNRFGQTVYITKSYKDNWDGSFSSSNTIENHRVPVGVYYYVLKPDATMGYIKGFIYIAY